MHEVWNVLEPDEAVLREEVLGTLNELIGRRKSQLLSSDVWESLGLPHSLRGLEQFHRKWLHSRSG